MFCLTGWDAPVASALLHTRNRPTDRQGNLSKRTTTSTMERQHTCGRRATVRRFSSGSRLPAVHFEVVPKLSVLFSNSFHEWLGGQVVGVNG